MLSIQNTAKSPPTGRCSEVSVAVARLDIALPFTALQETLFDVGGRGFVVVHGLGITGRGGPIVPRQSLNISPVRKQPCFKVMLGSVRVKSRFFAHPLAHLVLSFRCIQEIMLLGTSIHIR